MDDNGLCNLLEALMCLLSKNKSDATSAAAEQNTFPLSPASEAFAEVLICEIALKNRDRLSMLWHNHLREHYYTQLQNLSKTFFDSQEEVQLRISGSIEKCITGLLRISCFSIKRGEIANDVLSTWTLLDSCISEEKQICLLDALGLHIGEGLWRITRCIDDSSQLSEAGWNGILSLVKWCVHYGASLPPLPLSHAGRSVGLADDDPSIQVYRSLHYLLNVSEAKTQVPSVIGDYIHSLVVTGDKRKYAKLSIAGLDLLQVLSNAIESEAVSLNKSQSTAEIQNSFWKKNWIPVINNVASISRSSHNPVGSTYTFSYQYTVEVFRFSLSFFAFRLCVKMHFQCLQIPS